MRSETRSLCLTAQKMILSAIDATPITADASRLIAAGGELAVVLGPHFPGGDTEALNALDAARAALGHPPALNPLSYAERNLFGLAQLRLAQIWELEPESIPSWDLICRTVAALNSMEDFQLEPESRARVDNALDGMYETARDRRAVAAQNEG